MSITFIINKAYNLVHFNSIHYKKSILVKRVVPVFGVTQEHLRVPRTTSEEEFTIPFGTILPILDNIASGLGRPCFFLLLSLVLLPILPVDARLPVESLEQSEEQDALSDRFECKIFSCLLSTV